LKVELDNGEIINLAIHDRAGEESAAAATQTYYKGADAVILVYDVTDQESFEELEEAMDVALASVRDAANLVTYYVGNKSDLDHDNTDENKEMVEEE
jgi:Ras-related protein Rab-1A